MGGREEIELEFIYQTQTDRAVCVREDEDGEDVWLPLSQVSLDELTEPDRGDAITIVGPQWLFEAKGLL